MGVSGCSMFCCTLLYVHSSIAITLMGKRELIALLNLSSWCLVMVERLFLAVPRGCLQFVIVVFPDHTHLLFLRTLINRTSPFPILRGEGGIFSFSFQSFNRSLCKQIMNSSFTRSDTGIVIDSEPHLSRTCKTSLKFAPLAVHVHTGCSAFPFYTQTKSFTWLIRLYMRYKTVLFPKYNE